jgi:hypothetical protein
MYKNGSNISQKMIMLGGINHTVKLLGGNSLNKYAVISVNSETYSLYIGSIKTISGLNVYVKNIMFSNNSSSISVDLELRKGEIFSCADINKYMYGNLTCKSNCAGHDFSLCGNSSQGSGHSNVSSCVDSDGGFNLTVKGNASNGNVTKVDVCATSTVVSEAICSNNIPAYSTTGCPGGGNCSNGACLTIFVNTTTKTGGGTFV